MRYRIVGVLIGISIVLISFTIHKLTEEMKKMTMQESLDIQESRQREDRLAQYIKVLEYQISVISESIGNK